MIDTIITKIIMLSLLLASVSSSEEKVPSVACVRSTRVMQVTSLSGEDRGFDAGSCLLSPRNAYRREKTEISVARVGLSADEAVAAVMADLAISDRSESPLSPASFDGCSQSCVAKSPSACLAIAASQEPTVFVSPKLSPMGTSSPQLSACMGWTAEAASEAATSEAPAVFVNRKPPSVRLPSVQTLRVRRRSLRRHDSRYPDPDPENSACVRIARIEQRKHASAQALPENLRAAWMGSRRSILTTSSDASSGDTTQKE